MAKRTIVKAAAKHKQPSIDQQLRDAIAGCGLTPYAIAKQSGISLQSLYRYLGRERDLRWQTVAAIAEVLGLELSRRR